MSMKLEVKADTAEYGMVGKILGKVVIAASTKVGSSKYCKKELIVEEALLGECPA